jgi:erythromycin esterase-like protein
MTDAEFVREIAQSLASEARDCDALLHLIGNARYVLIGEASRNAIAGHGETDRDSVWS